jgi:hypothetical protein
MTYSGFDNMTFTGKNPFSNQKLNTFCDIETIPVDKLKIEIPINKINSATYNKDNKGNKLVTVFASCSCIQDRFQLRIPRPLKCHQSESQLVTNFLLSTRFCNARLVMLNKLLYPDCKNTRHASLLRPCIVILPYR